MAEIGAPDPTLGRIEGLLGREQKTIDAMASGADMVFQATFLDQRGGVLWRGHADFLHRVEGASQLGAHAYEPEDTKLARSVKASAVLQLCGYAFNRAAGDGFAVVTADSDFAMLLALRRATSPSVVQLRHIAELGPEDHLALLVATSDEDTTPSRDLPH